MALNERELRLLHIVSRSLHAIQQDVHAIYEQQRSEGDNENPPTEINGQVDVRVPPAVANYYASENRDGPKKVRRDRIRLCVEIIGMIAVIVAGIFAFRTFLEVRRQADAMDKTLKETRINFRTDERAWLEIDSIKKQTLPPEGKFPTTFKYQVFLKNVGKTMAKDAILRRVSSFGPIPNESGVKLAQKELLQPKAGRAPEVPPYPIPRAFAPNTVLPIPLILGGSPPEYNFTFYSSSIGRIDYADDFGLQHWLTFCLVIMNAAGDLQYCDYGNDEDRSPEK